MPSPQDHIVSIIAGIPLTMENWESVEEPDDGFKSETEMLVDEVFGPSKKDEPVEKLTDDEIKSLERMFGKIRVKWWLEGLGPEHSPTTMWWWYRADVTRLREMSNLNLDPSDGQIFDERHGKMRERKARHEEWKDLKYAERDKKLDGTNATWISVHSSHAYEAMPVPLRKNVDRFYGGWSRANKCQHVDTDSPRAWARAQVMAVMLEEAGCSGTMIENAMFSNPDTVDRATDNVMKRLGGDEFDSCTSKIELAALNRINVLNAMRGFDEGHTKPWLSVKQWKEENTSVKEMLDKNWSDL